MQVALQLVGALLMPVLAFGLVMWMAHLEETLASDVARARRQPEPAPILAIPVRVPQQPTQVVVVPGQRPAPVAEVLPMTGAAEAVTP
jgi:uncharacterized iron-regulated membrane protein